MKDLIMAGTYVVDSDKLEIGGVPILFFLLGVAVFVVIIAVVIICICSSKKKSNQQKAPLQPAVGQPPRPMPPMPPQPGQGVPVQPQMMQGAPVQPQTVQGAPVHPQMMQGAPVRPQMMQGTPVQPQTMQGTPVRPVQGDPVQPQAMQGVPVQPQPVQIQPQPVQIQPQPVQMQSQPVQMQPQPVQIQPQPVQVQPAPTWQPQPASSAQGAYGYGVSAADDKTQIITDDDDSTQIMTQEYVLCLSDKMDPEKTFRIPLRGTVIIGRRAGEANLVIDYDKSVSGRHCQVREADGRVFVEDMQSANGTMVDGKRILSETEIVSGSTLTLGRVELRVDISCE